jgi:3-oxoacyl-[acyl-carrier protein] reductase
MERVVLISGGGTGMGRAIARAFLADGDRVVVLGRRDNVLAATADELNAEHAGLAGSVSWQQADLTQPAEVERAVGAILGAVGETIDVVVNMAGGVDRNRSDDTLAEVAAQFERDFRANVLTAALLTHAAMPHLRRPGGRIINCSSIAAFHGGGGSYGAAKAALHAWTYTLATNLGPEGITANVIAPGYVEETEFFGATMTDARRQRLIGQTLVGRAGRPDDIGATVRFLASTDAAFITGQIVQVNGGALFGR